MPHLLKNASGYLLALLIGIVVGYSCLVAAYNIPLRLIQKNVDASMDSFSNGNGMIVKAINSSILGDTILDSYSDTVMLSEAAYKSGNPSYIAALTNELPFSQTDKNPGFSLLHYLMSLKLPESTRIYSSFPNTGKSQTDLATTHAYAYGRYWHGYLIYMKPLLLVMNYAQIVAMNEYVLMILMACALISIWKNSRNCVIPYILWAGTINLFATSQCIAFFPTCAVTLIMSCAELCLRKLKENEKAAVFSFFICGMVVNYFDMMFFTLLSLCIPLVLSMSISRKDAMGKLVYAIKCSLSWMAGYSGMWAAKWIISCAIAPEMRKSLIDAIVLRSNINAETIYSRTVSFIPNLRFLLSEKVSVVFVLYVALWGAVRLVRKIKAKKRSLEALPYLFVGLIPFVWMLLLNEHSLEHAWFMFRILTITLFSLGVFLSTGNTAKQDSFRKPL
jgi:hypothetical protein